MIKTVTVLVKKDDWTQHRFEKYWREVHGPLASAVKGIRRYVQSEIRDQILRKDITELNFPVSGIAEVWYDSIQSMHEARQSPEGQALLADGAKFIAYSRTLVVEEIEMIAGET